MSPLFWSILLMTAALCVIALELFVPSAGLLGALSVILILSSIIVAFFHSTQMGAIMIIATAILLPLLFSIAIKIWPHTPIGRLVLKGLPTEDEVLPTGGHYDQLNSLIGTTGIAKTKMLPSGMVVIEGKKYDCISDGLAIEPGDTVRVVAVKTRKIIVRKIDPDEASASGFEDEDFLTKPIENILEDDDVFG